MFRKLLHHLSTLQNTLSDRVAVCDCGVPAPETVWHHKLRNSMTVTFNEYWAVCTDILSYGTSFFKMGHLGVFIVLPGGGALCAVLRAVPCRCVLWCPS